jgi:hypothetical protein
MGGAHEGVQDQKKEKERQTHRKTTREKEVTSKEDRLWEEV